MTTAKQIRKWKTEFAEKHGFDHDGSYVPIDKVMEFAAFIAEKIFKDIEFHRLVLYQKGKTRDYPYPKLIQLHRERFNKIKSKYLGKEKG